MNDELADRTPRKQRLTDRQRETIGSTTQRHNLLVFLNDSYYKYFILAGDISRSFEYLFQTHLNATCVEFCVVKIYLMR